MIWYYYLYYKLYTFGKAISDDALNEWKPAVSISVLELLMLVQVVILNDNLARHFFSPEILVIFCIAVAAFNYYVFLHKNKWKTYTKTFKGFSAKKNIWGGVIVLVIILAILGWTVFGFYQQSVHDWKADFSRKLR